MRGDARAPTHAQIKPKALDFSLHRALDKLKNIPHVASPTINAAPNSFARENAALLLARKQNAAPAAIAGQPPPPVCLARPPPAQAVSKSSNCHPTAKHPAASAPVHANQLQHTAATPRQTNLRAATSPAHSLPPQTTMPPTQRLRKLPPAPTASATTGRGAKGKTPRDYGAETSADLIPKNKTR